MINIDEIEEICDAMIEEGMDYCPPAGCGTAANVKELITRLRKAERDSARWKKLIEMNDDSECELAVCTWHGGYEYSMVPDIHELIDAHIDESMQ